MSDGGCEETAGASSSAFIEDAFEEEQERRQSVHDAVAEGVREHSEDERHADRGVPVGTIWGNSSI